MTCGGRWMKGQCVSTSRQACCRIRRLLRCGEFVSQGGSWAFNRFEVHATAGTYSDCGTYTPATESYLELLRLPHLPAEELHRNSDLLSQDEHIYSGQEPWLLNVSAAHYQTHYALRVSFRAQAEWASEFSAIPDFITSLNWLWCFRRLSQVIRAQRTNYCHQIRFHPLFEEFSDRSTSSSAFREAGPSPLNTLPLPPPYLSSPPPTSLQLAWADCVVYNCGRTL